MPTFHIKRPGRRHLTASCSANADAGPFTPKSCIGNQKVQALIWLKRAFKRALQHMELPSGGLTLCGVHEQQGPEMRRPCHSIRAAAITLPSRPQWPVVVRASSRTARQVAPSFSHRIQGRHYTLLSPAEHVLVSIIDVAVSIPSGILIFTIETCLTIHEMKQIFDPPSIDLSAVTPSTPPAGSYIIQPMRCVQQGGATGVPAGWSRRRRPPGGPPPPTPAY